LDDIVEAPFSPFSRRGELIRFIIESNIDAIESEWEETGNLPSSNFNAEMRQREKSTGSLIRNDLPFHERKFEGKSLPPEDDDGIPVVEGFRDMQDMVSYYGNSWPRAKARIEAKEGMEWDTILACMSVNGVSTQYVDPQYASMEHIEEERAALNRGQLGPPTQ
jgi:hypothetical protein